MITVVNIYKLPTGPYPMTAYVGRSSSFMKAADLFVKAGGNRDNFRDCSCLGNPYPITERSSRNHVCDMYEKEFDEMISAGAAGDKITRMISWLKSTRSNLWLACFCAPSRCHAETIKRTLEAKL